MSSDSIQERIEAVVELGTLGDRAAVALEQALEDPDREVSSRAGELLRRMPLLRLESRLENPLSSSLGQRVVLRLKSGTRVEGRVRSVSRRAVDLELPENGAARTVRLSDIDLRSYYPLLREGLDPKMGRLRLKLAEWCVEQGLLKEAYDEYKLAAQQYLDLGEARPLASGDTNEDRSRAELQKAILLWMEGDRREATRVLHSFFDAGDRAYQQEAHRLIQAMAKDIRKENDEKRRRLKARPEMRCYSSALNERLRREWEAKRRAASKRREY